MKLFIDTEKKRLVAGLQSDKTANISMLFRGDAEAFEIHLLTPTGNPRAPFTDRVLGSTESVRVQLSDESGNMLVFADEFAPLKSGGVSGVVNFNTTELAAALADSPTISAVFEVEHIAADGSANTVLQLRTKINRDYIIVRPEISAVENFNQMILRKQAEFDSNAADKTAAFDTHAQDKQGEFDAHAQGKQAEFDSNAADKTAAFDTHAQDKQGEFDAHAQGKQAEFDSNAAEKTAAFDVHVAEKTGEFDAHAQDKQAAFDANAAEKTEQVNSTAAQVAADKVSAEGAKVAAQNAQSAAVAAQAAAELAKNQAQEIVDPDNRIGQLFQTKLDKGLIYCDGGFAKVPQSAFTSLSKATMLIHFARDGVPTSLETLCALGDGGTTQTGFLVRLTTDARFSVLCYFKKADGTGSDGPHVAAYNIAEYLDGKIHAFALCWSGTQTRIFIDGELKGQSAVSAAGMTVQSGTPGISFGARATTNAEYFRGKVSDFAVLNYDASEVDSNGNYTAAYSIADYQNGRAIPPWSVPVVFGNGKSATANATNAACVWDGANWSMTQTNNTATIKSMLYYIPMNVGQKLRIKFSNLTGGVLADGKYGFFQPVRQEADQINVSTTSLDAEFTAQTPITLWRFQFNCEAVEDSASRVPTVFENFTVERDGAIVALENYTIARNTTTKLIKDASGNGQDATVSGVLAGDRDNAVAAFVDELKTQISQTSTNN